MSFQNRKLLLIAIVFGVTSASFASPSLAGDDSYYMERNCRQLWQMRNSIYAGAGYCFKSRSAIRVFGRRCYPPYGKLHIGQRSTVRNIKRAERRKGC